MTTAERSQPLGPPWTVRVKAVLACGLALGTGATSTLAAWTDETHVQGEFTASTFELEANPSTPYTAAGPWSPHTEDAAVLQLDAEGLTPGSARYASLALRTVPGSLGGAAVLGGAEVTGDGGGDPQLGPALRYRAAVYDPGAGACDTGAFGSGADFVVGTAGSTVPLTAGGAAESPLVLPEADDSEPGIPVHVCFELSLPSGADNALQGRSATARWQIISTSETA